ncbi:putative circadian clock protein, KaiC [Caldithrix abyssi DSM 13497]|uniref:non-specific serine/threonine protein kinase n=1 Tax=Caldithrix abyssi DSM 13497 TaxID=880073 RepID=H1XNH6_CALAY|nr:circadian clock protein KaiC [Caldithrix abyssi]APF18114.1 circadian clock protein KaiC [Caldithrix abyssi DSM 13497]EHO42147.1 putative circadian clock protein, KaiC [Caldithrix abyssi DSM 13497]
METVLLPKASTGITGLDEITRGGLPAGRPTLVYGGPGTGKTLFGLQFIAHGVKQNEKGVILTFEETAEDLITYARSIGIDLAKMIKEKRVIIDYFDLSGNDVHEAGTYDLEGLFLRLQAAVEEIGAKRVHLDTLEALFAFFEKEEIIRKEFSRLFHWLKRRKLTTVVTAEISLTSEIPVTRYGLEEYVSDCVIFLDNRVEKQVATRRLRILKYRGSSHGTNEYPFLIDDDGITVFPITSVKLEYQVSTERISTGIPDLDQMLDGGIYRGSTVLISGTAGTGKSTMGISFANAACERNEKALYVSFEESPAQIVRNMASVGFDLQKHIDSGLLEIHSQRPTMYGLELHLAKMIDLINKVSPSVIVIDPINSFLTDSEERDVKLMLMRFTDLLKEKNISAFMLSLTGGGEHTERTNVAISSIVDTWIILRDVEQAGERNRALFILKSRGHKHSNQVREFLITSQGIKLVEIYEGAEGLLTGSARVAQKTREEMVLENLNQELKRLEKLISSRKKLFDNQIELLKANFESEIETLELKHKQVLQQKTRLEAQRQMIQKLRS